MVGKLVNDAAVGLCWGEPIDGKAQSLQVHVAHSLKVQVIGIHGAPGRMQKVGEITNETLAPGG